MARPGPEPRSQPPAAYLNGQVEEHEVPVRARHDKLVDDSHGDGSQAVPENRGSGVMGKRRQRAATRLLLDTTRRSWLILAIQLLQLMLFPVC